MRVRASWIHALAVLGGCTKGEESGSDPCREADAATGPVYASFVLHNEEDVAFGMPNPLEPDYDGDPAVFAHFSTEVMAFAQTISDAGATLSVQSDWTFLAGVEAYDPGYLERLDALPGVELAPHGHETAVPYDQLYETLLALAPDAQPYLGGMTFELYASRQAWFEAHPEFVIWEAPTVSEEHLEDLPAPPFVYRAPRPDDVSAVPDLYRFDADGVLVTPGVASESPAFGPVRASSWIENKPDGRFVVPAYIRYGTRGFLAEPDDTSVPEQWRAPEPSLASSAVIDDALRVITEDVAPFVADGSVAWRSISEIIELYRTHEACLALEDGAPLDGYVDAAP